MALKSWDAEEEVSFQSLGWAWFAISIPPSRKTQISPIFFPYRGMLSISPGIPVPLQGIWVPSLLFRCVWHLQLSLQCIIRPKEPQAQQVPLFLPSLSLKKRLFSWPPGIQLRFLGGRNSSSATKRRRTKPPPNPTHSSNPSTRTPSPSTRTPLPFSPGFHVSYNSLQTRIGHKLSSA